MELNWADGFEVNVRIKGQIWETANYICFPAPPKESFSWIKTIAEAHGVSSAQVILRWDLQRGIVVIPGSSNPEHIRENLDLFSFELTEEEMAAIGALDRSEKHDWY